ncbi:MAG: vitamin K epoxide reductase family protein, partial [Nannocystaceae bacterium]
MTTEEQRIRGILLGLVLVLAVLGVADGWYLTMVHVDYELSPDSALRKVCGALASNGCAVTTGRFGDVLGVPVSVIGMGGAAATAITAAVARRRHVQAHDPWRSTAFALASVSVLASLLMGT